MQKETNKFVQGYYPAMKCGGYRDLKTLWFNLKRQGRYFEADQVKNQLKKLRKNV